MKNTSIALRMLGVAAACGLGVGMLGSTAAMGGDIIANSQSQFSGTQGQQGWFYGYYTGTQTPAGFVQYPTFAAARSGWERTPSAWAGTNPGYFCTITAGGGHPHAVAGSIIEVNSAVRRWVSTFSGSVRLQGAFRKTSTFFSGVQDGIVGRVFVDGVEVFSTTIPATDDAERTFDLPTCINSGSIVDIVIDPRANEFSDGAEARLSVVASGPSIQGGPNSSVACPTFITAFGVNAVSGGVGSGLTYRWQIQAVAGGDWVDLTSATQAIACPAGASAGQAQASGATTGTLLLRVRPCTGGGINAANASNFGVRCIVGDGCSTFISTAVTYTVCPADFNCQSGVTVQDVFDFLTAWFAGDVRADINLAGGITVQDVFDFLGAWFAGCAAG
jgi:hypothetical protein